MRRLAAFVLLVFLTWTPAFAQQKALKGVALVIGQEDYAHLSDLANPGNDARAIQKLLTDLGFEARAVSNRDLTKLSRDLDRFIEDATEADVAVLYYSGHGIEAGGENYLLPVDADVTSLADAGKTLVPLSGIITKLQSAAPLSIVLLDACRNSPFPANSVIVAGPEGAPVSVGAAGLAETKGMEIAGEQSGEQSGQTLIGFAAAPGLAALDGAAGGNSPYAAALLKHLAAAKGHDFGDVMTMVSQEVYLQTAGRQQPWVNTNLRHLLYFGLAPEEATGEEALITAERRKLLLTIARTPDEIRRTVETIAQSDKLPLATLYGLLSALNVDTSTGQDDLEKQLRAGAENLKKILTERDAREKSDSELIRLSKLADKAENEGAIKLALDFRAKASARADEIDTSLDNDEANIKARRIELAQTYAEHAETAILNFNYQTAAAKYATAYEQVAGRDDTLAFRYKFAEASSLRDHGAYQGDNDMLTRAIASYRIALALVPRDRWPNEWALVQNNLGITLSALGERGNDIENLEKASKAYEATLEEWTRERVPLQWAAVQNNLGTLFLTLGEHRNDKENFAKAVKAFEAVLEVYTRKEAPEEWAMTQNNLGNVFFALGLRGDDNENLIKAVKAYEATLEVWAREEMPLQWAAAQHNLGDALKILGTRERGTETLQKAVKAYEAALEERPRERAPLYWAATQHNLGTTLTTLGERAKNRDMLYAARRALQASWDFYKSAGYDYEDYFAEDFARIDKTLATMK